MEKEKEEYDLTDEQKFYSEYNSHVTEEQLSYAIIETICHEMSNSSIERLPRIIFYFNLYIFKSSIEKERIAFTAKEKEYGFEEADGVFYLGSDDLILNQNGNIPFLKNKKYVLNINDNAVEIDEDKPITKSFYGIFSMFFKDFSILKQFNLYHTQLNVNISTLFLIKWNQLFFSDE